MWAAPSILSIDAAAAASCGSGTHTLNWGNVTAGTSPASVTSSGGAPLAVAIGHTQTGNTVANGGLGGYDCFDVIDAQVGNQSAHSYLLQIATSNRNRFVTVTFTFPVGTTVNGLSFQVFDIDYSTTYNFQDIITVTGVKAGGGAAAFSATPGTAFTVGGTATSRMMTGAAGGNPATGQPTDSTSGNSTVTSTDSIASVTIRYEPGTPRDANPYQYVSIGNLTWTGCT